MPLASKRHVFGVGAQLNMFLTYCFDMKVLQIEVGESGGAGVARGGVNFGLLREWIGEEV